MSGDCSNILIFPDKYEITFKGVDNNNKWTYHVKELGGGQDISNWALEICPQAIVTNPNPSDAEIGDPNQGQGQGNCLNINNDIGCIDPEDPPVEQQIKWNVEGGFTEGDFEFTLDQCFAVGCVRVAIKAGNECFCGTIQGPTCEECPPEPGRGILFI